MIGGPSTSYTLEVSGFFGNAGMGRGGLPKETRLHISIIVIAIYSVSENFSFIEIFQNWKYLIESLLMLKLIEKQLFWVLLIQLSFS